jgi:hypothetical protein
MAAMPCDGGDFGDSARFAHSIAALIKSQVPFSTLHRL